MGCFFSKGAATNLLHSWKPPNLLDNDWNVLWSSIFRKYTWKRRHSVLEGFHKFVKFIKFWRQLHFLGTSAPFHWQSISNSTQSKWMEYGCKWTIPTKRSFDLWDYGRVFETWSFSFKVFRSSLTWPLLVSGGSSEHRSDWTFHVEDYMLNTLHV